MYIHDIGYTQIILHTFTLQHYALYRMAVQFIPYLVINVGDVHDVVHLIPKVVREHASQDVKSDVRPVHDGGDSALAPALTPVLRQCGTWRGPCELHRRRWVHSCTRSLWAGPEAQTLPVEQWRER